MEKKMTEEQTKITVHTLSEYVDAVSKTNTIDYHGIDKKQRRENQAKRQGIIMY